MHDEPAVPPGMQRYYLCFLRPGPAYTTEESPELARLYAAHLAHLTALLQAGHSLVSGPVLDASDLRGLTIFCTASRAEAATLAAQDPAVQAGRFVVEIYPWLVPAGILPGAETGVGPGAA
ncbi:MAG TPA: YciI family protein [Chloroflexia bacterium]|nr:YciI family protein [Chloroflexia bacterium]